MLSTSIVCTLFLACYSTVQAFTKEDCDHWASVGECDANPGFMLQNCKSSCDAVDKEIELDPSIKSFYDLKANDIDGKEMDFEQFRGKVAIIVNVASYCGYTESHYKQLVGLHTEISGTGRVEILAFPCNQFGEQEPEGPSAIKRFAHDKGVRFTMMEKINVNGPDAHNVYKFLKKTAGPNRIQWNFATYFVVGPDGDVQSFSGVVPSELQGVALELLDKSEL